MSDRKSGISNPWDVKGAVAPTEKSSRKIDLKDIDFDADLAVPGKYVIRGRLAAFDVTHVGVHQPGDALYILADLLMHLFRTEEGIARLSAAGVGVYIDDNSFNEPDEGEPVSKLEAEHAVVWFRGVGLDQGMLELARVLKEPFAATSAKQWGVTPMLVS